MARKYAQRKSNTIPFPLMLMRLLFNQLGPVFPNLLANYAYRLWFTPTHGNMPEIEQLIANKAKASDLIVVGHRVRVWSWGEGPTILFIHGWGGRGTQISSFVEPFNQAGFKIMSFDMPAHGQSEDKKTNAFIIANVLDKVLQQIDNLHSVITHSFGGIVWGYLYSPNIPLKNMVLICPPANLQTPFDQFSETLALPQNVKTILKNKLLKNFGNDLFERISLINNAAKITQPALVIHDREDTLVPFEDGEAVAKAIRKGSFYETNELGHQKVLFDPKVIEYILQYISNTF